MTRLARSCLALSLLLLPSCHHQKSAEPTATAPTVSYVQPPSCSLPDLPDPIQPQIVGYPTPEQILITKTDMIAIVDYVNALHDWVRAAHDCLETR